MPNRLAQTQSPYLLQHQDNPVDWWPWGEAAFEAARAQDKPVFLSVGYATCHWCHVMAHESFEDPAVARLMNETFINVKVDREERPDVDSLYMTVCQMTTGHGGWPLTVLLTPDKKPFFAATYLPKESRHGRMGMLDFVPRVAEAWQHQRDRLLASADELVGLLEQSAGYTGADRDLTSAHLDLAFEHLRRRFDREHGGFGTAPKFPSPHNLVFLLRYAHRTGDPEATAMAVQTLHAMRCGGLFDHVGYGFHRYATDATWTLPHFEKMLYDQATLLRAYTEAYHATGEARFAETAHAICTYVLRDLRDPAGGFYAAEDADSEGREGAFYVWTEAEARDLLGDLADLYLAVYSFESEGNFEDEATRRRTGENIPHLRQPLEATAAERGLSLAELEETLEVARQQLFAHREGRERPLLDDEVLTDWNGLMIGALAYAGRVLDAPAYVEAAEEAARFVLEALRTDSGRLLHRWRQGTAGIPALLDDYAFFIAALLDLYETTFDVAYLREALSLQEVLDAHFWDADHGAYFFTPDDGEALLIRQKEAYDGALPSGNSAALLNLVRLGRMTGDTGYDERAVAIGRFFAEAVGKQPAGFTALLLGLDLAVGPSREVVLAGDLAAADTQALVAAVRTPYAPRTVVLHRPPGDAPPITELAPFIQAQDLVDGQPAAYVCRDFVCDAPTTDPGVLRQSL